MNNKKTTIHAEVLLSSGTTQQTTDYKIEDMNNETKIKLQQELIDLYEQQIMDLTMMSKIELGDDVIEEIGRLKDLIYEQTR